MEQNSKKNDISRKIISRYGSIRRPNNSNIEVNIIRWNYGKSKLDIRPWSADGIIAMKGITLSREGFLSLMRILNEVDVELIDSENTLYEKKTEFAPLPEEPKIPEALSESDDVDFFDEGEEENVPLVIDDVEESAGESDVNSVAS